MKYYIGKIEEVNGEFEYGTEYLFKTEGDQTASYFSKIELGNYISYRIDKYIKKLNHKGKKIFFIYFSIL
jgi:hypothetical protein